ncbi:pyrroline-5-carboxylate reductase [Gordonia sp. X0973]|uniref:pyrroline-5-carboxylate reductase n=1 Tax=Gordonia sp. X0973 TaxID=2742602 RepID=UPI000F5362A5|nr:pyrroline-5-carboxylate reductase [Gordonia sp. X0973]QKT08419.1 pyrroline-5-carboxylate reductase [Gordonia sp. X0973]
MSERVAIIGGGKIGEALLAGLLAAGKQARDLVVVERSAARAAELADEYKVLVTDVAGAVENARVVVIAVKPEAVDGVLAEIGRVEDNNDAERVTVTLVAGLPTAKYENALPAGSPVIRVMSNTPLLVNEAMSAISPGRYVTDEQIELVSSLLSAVGKVMVVPERLMDAVTAVSGSGPAYVFLLAESMIDAGVALGLSRAQAAELAKQTIRGAGAMLTESGMTSVDLRAAVTSPGGTTAAAIIELERGGLRSSMYSATAAAAAKSAQLSRRSELEGSAGNGGDGRDGRT